MSLKLQVAMKPDGSLSNPAPFPAAQPPLLEPKVAPPAASSSTPPEPASASPASPLPDSLSADSVPSCSTVPESNSTHLFHPYPGETPRAYSAFMAFFELGHHRSLTSVAQALAENPATVKNWSCKYHWSERIQSFNAGLLQQQAELEAASRREQAADWVRRNSEFRAQQWALAQKLQNAALCYLDVFGDQEVQKMTLAQVSRAIQVSSKLALDALNAAAITEASAPSTTDCEMMAALERAYGRLPQDKPESSTPASPSASVAKPI